MLTIIAVYNRQMDFTHYVLTSMDLSGWHRGIASLVFSHRGSTRIARIFASHRIATSVFAPIAAHIATLPASRNIGHSGMDVSQNTIKSVIVGGIFRKKNWRMILSICPKEHYIDDPQFLPSKSFEDPQNLARILRIYPRSFGKEILKNIWRIYPQNILRMFC